MYEGVKPQPIIAPARNGIGAAELKLLATALFFIEKQARRLGLKVCLITIGDDLFGMDYAARLNTIKEIAKRVTKWQGRAGIPQYSVYAIELLGGAGLHAHCVALVDDQLVRKIRASTLIRPFCQGEDAITRIDNREAVVSYLSKERTTQANRSFQGAGIPLPTMKPPTKLLGAGDRVRLSDALKAGVIEAGLQRPYRVTHWKLKELIGVTETPISPRWVKAQAKNARRSTFMSVSVAVVNAPETAPKPAGQLYLFQELERPITRLADFTAGILSPSASLELEHRRKRLGLSQSQLGRLAGLSQPQIANAVHGRFGLSRHAASRIKAALFPTHQRQEAA